MISLLEFVSKFLTEAKSAPLYHGTSFDGIVEILKAGKIKPSSNGRTSTARSLHAIAGSHGRDGYFVIDQLKLSYNRQIKPTDWFMGGSVVDHADDTLRDADYRRGETEESVKGDIPLRYVTELVINTRFNNLSSKMDEVEKEMEDEVKQNPSLMKTVWTNGTPYQKRMKKIKSFTKLVHKYPHIKLTYMKY